MAVVVILEMDGLYDMAHMALKLETLLLVHLLLDDVCQSVVLVC